MLIETLTQEEARVLGTLLEKSLATPDYYPMTLNSLRNACNQKSSRDPVTEYADETVSEALNGLKRKCLVTFIPYGSQGNTYKYRHFLEDVRFNLGKPDLAVLAVLLLRGAQTLNEVRLRASSLHPVESLEKAEAVLQSLAKRDEPLAVWIAKRPGWKEPRWRDTVREPLAEGAASAGESETSLSAPVPKPSAPPPGPDEIASLRAEVSDMRAALAALASQVAALRSELGVG